MCVMVNYFSKNVFARVTYHFMVNGFISAFLPNIESKPVN
jgi:hypothetical protein